jgi:hypothetical protein
MGLGFHGLKTAAVTPQQMGRPFKGGRVCPGREVCGLAAGQCGAGRRDSRWSRELEETKATFGP